MMAPQLYYALSPDKREVAVSASLVPTFDPIAPQDAIEVLQDEKPEQLSYQSGASFHFMFLVDRSYSMTEEGRMSKAQEALDIFVRSLPPGCTFSIISFGSRYEAMDFEGETCMINDDECRDLVLWKIKNMKADLGGTMILEPLKQCQ